MPQLAEQSFEPLPKSGDQCHDQPSHNPTPNHLCQLLCWRSVRAGYAGGGDMSDYEELKRLAEAFPSDLDWDSNTEPFFNGPSGESLGGGSTGFYCVYGKPFRLEGEDYDYDGPTYVETCTADFAKFMVSARDGMLALIAERDQFKAENEALRKAVEQSVEWFGRISSGDGSGHADLGRAILRIAGSAMSKEP